MSMDYCGGTGQWEWTIVVLQANEYGLLWQPKLAAKSINFLISRILLSKLLKIIFYCVFDKASIPHSQRSGLLGLKRWWPAQLALSKNSFYQKIETNSWNSSQGESQWLGKPGFNSSRVLNLCCLLAILLGTEPISGLPLSALYCCVISISLSLFFFF